RRRTVLPHVPGGAGGGGDLLPVPGRDAVRPPPVGARPAPVRHQRAEGAVPAPAVLRRVARRVRADGGLQRLGRRVAAVPGGAVGRWERVSADRVEALHHHAGEAELYLVMARTGEEGPR